MKLDEYDEELIPFTIKDSLFGPVLDSILESRGISFESNETEKYGSYSIALKSQALEEHIDLKFYRKMNKAKNWKEFLDASREFRNVPINILYSDRNGNIGSALTR